MEIIILGCVIGGVVGYLLGNLKGAGGAGFALGLLLGPIGWVIALLLSDKRRKCPLCQGAVPEGKLARCKNCGGDLTASARARGAAMEAVDPVEAWEREQAGTPVLPVPEHLRRGK